jgi:hypothetical protein
MLILQMTFLRDIVLLEVLFVACDLEEQFLGGVDRGPAVALKITNDWPK